MKVKSLLLAGVLAASVTGAANATTITLTQNLTLDGQDFTFSFSGITSFIGGAVVTIASGLGGTMGLDLSGAFPAETEYFDVTFDGAGQGAFSCGGPSSVGATAIAGAVDNSFNFNNCQFSLPIAISAIHFASLVADGALDVGVLFGDDVSTFGDNDEVVVSLTYDSGQVSPVPLPATALLLGAGLFGLGAAARRRNAKA